MTSLALSIVLAVSPSAEPAVVSCSSTSELAATLASEMQTGTLLFSRGDCLAIKVFTKSPYTHVAMVVLRDGKPVVYDSQNGVGVRSLPLADWLEAQRPETIHVHQPVSEYGAIRTGPFVSALDQDLGRPYAVRHHLTGERCDGRHCAEYATDALMAAKLITAKEPPRVSPASLRQGLLDAGLYEATKTIRLVDPAPPVEQGTGWCSQMWIDTKSCTSSCCVKMRRWFLCR